MENPKYSHKEQKWAEDLVHKLVAEFPDANIHTDGEYYIYTIVHPDGEHAERHTPKGMGNAEEVIRSRLNQGTANSK